MVESKEESIVKNFVENIKVSENNNTIVSIIKGVIIAIVFTLLLLLLFSIFLTYTNIQENTIAPIIIVVTAISILAGASIATIKIKKNGIINGGMIGGIYMILLYLLSSILETGFSLNMYAIVMIIFAMLAGMIGGIVGVNIKK